MCSPWTRDVNWPAVTVMATAIATALALAAAGTGLAGTPIAIVNPGFESPALGLCSFNFLATGWTTSSGGAWRPGSGTECLQSYPGGVPEGAQIGYCNSSDLSQTLTATLQANTQYVLSAKVGRRNDCCQQATYRVQLWAGATMLFEDPGLLPLTPGGFVTSRVWFGAGPGHPAIGQPLKIVLVRGPLGQGNFDAVSLEASPADCNNNGVLDSVDIANGTVTDSNGNGVPDQCEVIVTPCPADIAPPPSGDGTVNVNDLLNVINNWGPCSGCAADIAPLPDGDGTVNVNDLLAVINGWGPC